MPDLNYGYMHNISNRTAMLLPVCAASLSIRAIVFNGLFYCLFSGCGCERKKSPHWAGLGERQLPALLAVSPQIGLGRSVVSHHAKTRRRIIAVQYQHPAGGAGHIAATGSDQA
jgi:hypothetical protein